MIEATLVSATDSQGPTTFGSVGTSTGAKPWSSQATDPYVIRVGHRREQGWSSSLREDSWESLQRSAWFFMTGSTAHSSMFDYLSDTDHAYLPRASVNAMDAHANLFEIRRLTGLNWIRLADLLNVDRRTIHNWVKGGQVRKVNRRHVAETLKVLRFTDRGSSEMNATALEEPSVSGLTVLDLIKSTQYVKAQSTLGLGVSRPLAATKETVPSPGTGTFRPIVTHEAADGSDKIEPLPYEPMSRSRKKRLDRG